MDDITIYEEYGPIDGYHKFEELPVMVITAVARFRGNVLNIREFVYLIPITKVRVDRPSRPVKKIRIPWPGQAGLMMNATLGDVVRGLVRSITKGNWDNSIMIDVSTSEKNINVKLSKSNIQMTGCKSIEMANEAAHIMIDEINKISNHIELMRDHLIEAYEISRQILDEGSGKIVKNENEQPYVKFSILNLQSHDEDSEAESAIRGFFASQLIDCRKYAQAYHKLNWLLQRKDVIDQTLELDHIQYGMVKYRFNIGFHVDQDALYELLPEIAPEFSIDYHPDIRDYVKIELDCFTKVKTKNDIKKHTFSIQPSGQTNYSCPLFEEMSSVYYRFIYVINELRPDIEVKS